MQGEEKKEVQKPEAEAQKIVDSSRNIVWLSEIGKKDVAIAGGKGANLAELYNAELNVPPAFIVTAYAYHNFLEESGLKKEILEIVNNIDLENTTELNAKAKEIREMIIAEKMPEHLSREIIEAYSDLNVDKSALEGASAHVLGIMRAAKEPCFVAVRSSATTEDLITASFAGQHN